MAELVYWPGTVATAITRILELAPEASVVLPLTVFPETPKVADPLMTCAATEVKLAGTTSEKVAPTTGLGPLLLITKVKVTVCPTATVGALLVLERAKSALGVTASVSAAEQIPATVQEAFGLVFVNPAGGATLATLRTEVCAMANGARTINITPSSQDVLKIAINL